MTGWGRELTMVLMVPLFGAAGLAAGGVTGALLSRPETIKISGADEAEIRAAIEGSRRQARVQDFQ